jgi:hypothetical protein
MVLAKAFSFMRPAKGREALAKPLHCQPLPRTIALNFTGVAIMDAEYDQQ